MFDEAKFLTKGNLGDDIQSKVRYGLGKVHRAQVVVRGYVLSVDELKHGKQLIIDVFFQMKVFFTGILQYKDQRRMKRTVWMDLRQAPCDCEYPYAALRR